MIKKQVAILFLFLALGFLLSHQLVPHHHHGISEIATNNHAHDHDQEGDHSHQLFDLFFSLFHHTNYNTPVVIVHNSTYNKFSKLVLSSFSQTYENYPRTDYAAFVIHKEQHSFDQQTSILLRSFSFRGPPIA